jgi:hypothetical protein
MANINMIRVAARLKEMFDEKIDMSDFPSGSSSHFETRAIAALALMMICGLDSQQSSIHITDGYHDMGIDAIYLDNTQKQLIVIQSKWRGEGTGSISQDEMNSFVEGIKRIINFDLDGANQRILQKKTDIDYSLTTFGYQIHVLFVHTGNSFVTKYIKRPLTDLMNTTNDDISTLIIYDEITFKEIYTYLAQGQNPESISLDDVILNNWGKIDEPYSAYYGTISAAAIGEWYKNYGNALFAKNIRFYKGNTEVNDGMKRTLLQEPENFYYYNNGIKILCESIKRKAKDSTTNTTGLFTLQGISLVNGAQTAGTIGSVYHQAPEQVVKAYVMVQIIDLSKAQSTAAAQITKLSNTQNRIDSKDFASLDTEQDRLRTELAFSHFIYLYKSGDTVTDFEHQITFDEAIVALACWHGDLSYATIAKRNIGALSEDINKPPYKALFNPSTNSFILLNSVMAIRKIESILQVRKEQLVGRERLVCVHANRFISYCILQVVKINENYTNEILKSELLESIVYPIIDQLISQIVVQMNTLYTDNSYPANIFKNAGKCKEIYNLIYNG